MQCNEHSLCGRLSIKTTPHQPAEIHLEYIYFATKLKHIKQVGFFYVITRGILNKSVGPKEQRKQCKLFPRVNTAYNLTNGEAVKCLISIYIAKL